MSPRAPALSPQERRESIVAASLPLILEYGRAVTTRQIAEAADIAEGTIFRVFETKDEVIDAVVDATFDMEPYLRALEQVDAGGSIDDVLTRIAQLMIDRFANVFRLMSVLRLGGPGAHRHPQGWQDRVAAAHQDLLAPHAGELRIPPADLMRYVRMLAFSGCNPHVTAGAVLTAPEIVDLVLDGARKDS